MSCTSVFRNKKDIRAFSRLCCCFVFLIFVLKLSWYNKNEKKNLCINNLTSSQCVTTDLVSSSGEISKDRSCFGISLSDSTLLYTPCRNSGYVLRRADMTVDGYNFGTGPWKNMCHLWYYKRFYTTLFFLSSNALVSNSFTLSNSLCLSGFNTLIGVNSIKSQRNQVVALHLCND